MPPIAFTCALGAQLVVDNHYTTIYLPLDVVSLWPVFTKEIAGRNSLYVQLFAAILLAVALDHTTAVVSPRRRVSLPLWWA